MNYQVLPPEINSLLMYSGAGSTPCCSGESGRVGVRVGLGGARATTPRALQPDRLLRGHLRGIFSQPKNQCSSCGVVGQLEQRLREDPNPL